MARKEAAVVLVRHGRAEDDNPGGDVARGLTEAGRREMREHARDLRERLDLDGLATSPLARAVQTAEILAEALEVTRVVVRSELAATESPDAVIALARELGVAWALVGHNPAFGKALARMAGAAMPAVRFRKGAAAALAPAEGGHWRFLWMAAPGKKVKRTLE